MQTIKSKRQRIAISNRAFTDAMDQAQCKQIL